MTLRALPARLALATGPAMMVVASPLAAQRAETTSPAIVFANATCPLTPHDKLEGERKSTSEFIGPLLASLFAGFAGDLVKTGVNAVGDALDAASREQGFAAEGTAPVRFGQVDPNSGSGSPATYTPTEQCLSLYVPSGEGRIADFWRDSALTTLEFDWKGNEDARTNIGRDLENQGLTTLPALYAEGMVLPGKEGFIFRPTLVWYRSPLPGAPKGAASAEMHVLFATPGFDAKTPGIGSGFAGARLQLPKLTPGTALGWDQLRGARSVWLPLRPTAGAVDAEVQAINTAKTLVGTRTVELAKADKAMAAATRAQARKPGSDADEALILATEARAEAEASLAKARAATANLVARPAGATNAQMRVVIVRDANKFGQALAKAIKGQAETAGKGVTDGLKPQPAWAATDTGYLSAMIAVEQKQKAYDDAVASGDAAAMTNAGNDLKIAKAKANEAAVAANMDIPYPGLIAGL